MPTAAIVLAAGKGTRMQSELPKVLVPLAGRPMVEYVLDAIRAVSIERIVVVVGYRDDLVRAALANRPDVEFALQSPQHGTGHAVMVCREQLANHSGPVLILTGDSPLVRAESLRGMLAEFEKSQPACLLGTARKEPPGNLGRIVRDAAGNFAAIVEQKDATTEQLKISEVNMSYYVFDSAALWESLDQVTPSNAQGEYYITDCPGILKAAGRDVRARCVLAGEETLSINTPEELAAAERAMSYEH